VRIKTISSQKQRATALAYLTGAKRLDASNNIHAFAHIAKDRMLSIEPTSGSSADEELRSVRVGTSIGH
jgi:hypothetical protein